MIKKKLLAFAVAIIFHFAGFVKAAAFVIAYLIAGWDVLFKAAKNILKGDFFIISPLLSTMFA